MNRQANPEHFFANYSKRRSALPQAAWLALRVLVLLVTLALAGAFTLALRASVVDGMRTAPHVALPFDTILRRAAVPSGPFR